MTEPFVPTPKVESQAARPATPSQDKPLSSAPTFPDRVTLQPATRIWKTPLCKYKVARGVTKQGVNSSKVAARRLGITEAEFNDALTQEINDLLKEIETARLEALRHTDDILESNDTQGVTEERRGLSDPVQQNEEVKWNGLKHDRIQSPHLTKGKTFTATSQALEKTGSHLTATPRLRTKRGRGRVRTSTPPRRDLPPPPPPCRTSSPTSDDEQGQSITNDEQQKGHRIPDLTQHTSAHDPSVPAEEDVITVLPDRPTFFHHTPVKRSPFARYLKLPVEDRPPSVPPAHVRLGLSKEEFDSRLTAEIDEFLLTEREGRRRDKESAGNVPSSSELKLSPHALTKEGALRFVEDHGLPRTGPILGVLWWALDIDRNRFNFDFDFDRDDLSILNAYD